MRAVARNVEVPGGELDILALDGRRRVAIEVRSRTRIEDPLGAINGTKRSRVKRLALLTGATRLDLIGILLTREHVDIHWLPDA